MLWIHVDIHLNHVWYIYNRKILRNNAKIRKLMALLATVVVLVAVSTSKSELTLKKQLRVFGIWAQFFWFFFDLIVCWMYFFNVWYQRISKIKCSKAKIAIFKDFFLCSRCWKGSIEICSLAPFGSPHRSRNSWAKHQVGWEAQRDLLFRLLSSWIPGQSPLTKFYLF